MQGYFDLIHLPYSTSGVLVEAMTFDKYVLNNYLSGFGINVADSILLRRGEAYDEEEIAKRIGMPCFCLLYTSSRLRLIPCHLQLYASEDAGFRHRGSMRCV